MNVFVLVLMGCCGAMLTFFVNTRLSQGPVKSSALLTMFVVAFLYLFPNLLSPYLTKNIPYIFIGSSFIGMVSSQQLSTYIGIALSGLIFSLIYLNTSQFFAGYGGALGTSSCISLLVVLSIPYFKSKRKLTVGMLQLRKLVIKGKRRKPNEKVGL
ncbi:hypothetical protein Pedsa_1492 [Pseudopedobacter saltans DSM 12145]|uniref:Uncharacterized protein n=1 Tax=Pseudopedobacter saltans (strain ATCC 51119 / DSM 12145 / JCM 21818 / CCUG 39354 / LMG 10337 / NBRC 100064 / NCIMB 13643) TaxID=762903 RepID=F0S5A8_PSESL|nr:hypothetical protein [Pseudopedobacter saltans]ADY52053.1 hypothetical protein Pedsa_1492 [Pseudopedobacter saltans DSM 12145]